MREEYGLMFEVRSHQPALNGLAWRHVRKAPLRAATRLQGLTHVMPPLAC